MKELLETIVSELVENKDAVEVVVDEPNAEGIVVYHLHVAPDDMGRVIGKQGRMQRTIRGRVPVQRMLCKRACYLQRTFLP